MNKKKFITIDLQTGKKILQTIEASYIKFSDERLQGVTDLNAALKAEITRAIEAEQALTTKVEQEIQRAESAEAAIRQLIGDLGQEDKSVKEALDRIKASITALTEKVDAHIANQEVHITADERARWEKTATDLAEKADKATTEQELEKKVNKDELFDNNKIKTDLLPSIAVNDVHTVTNVKEAMDLKIENGDVVIINPDAKTPKSNNEVVTGTFICVDATKESFEERFRQLYSNTDSISKAEVDNLIKAEADRAKEVEEGLRRDILIINDNDDTTVGSIKHAVKVERERAEAAERELAQRLTTIEPTVQKLAGGKEVEGSAANLADKALTEAKEYANQKIEEVKTSAGALSDKVQALEEKVGTETAGLVKDVKELQTKVDVINGEGEGSIKKALADAQKHADQKVAEEATIRKAEDDKLSKRIDALEASEEFKVSLGFEGAEVSDLLAVKADGKIVKATLDDSSVVGIVVKAEGENSKTAVMGKVGGFSDLIPGKSYFLGSDGRITRDIPTQVGQHIIKVGVAISQTELFVNIEEAIEICD